MFYAKLHISQGEAVLAACDSELIGMVLEYKGIKVSITMGFYGNEEVDEDLLSAMMAQSSSMNLFGERTIDIAVRDGFADKDNIMLINGIPHIQVYYF